MCECVCGVGRVHYGALQKAQLLSPRGRKLILRNIAANTKLPRMCKPSSMESMVYGFNLLIVSTPLSAGLRRAFNARVLTLILLAQTTTRPPMEEKRQQNGYKGNEEKVVCEWTACPKRAISELPECGSVFSICVLCYFKGKPEQMITLDFRYDNAEEAMRNGVINAFPPFPSHLFLVSLLCFCACGLAFGDKRI